MRDFPHPLRPALGPTKPAESKAHRISFPGVMRPAHGVDHPLPYSAEVKEIVELYLYSPLWAFMAGYILPKILNKS